MSAEYEIRARYDKETVVVYQAYGESIADAALREQRFVAPFSFRRMTWIKPSFRWLMYRSNWGQKKNQERTLAIRILRSGWEKALAQGVLTHPEPTVYSHPALWEKQFKNATVHIQWDTERTLRGAALNQFSIQVGLSREIIREFVDEWIVEIEDMTPAVTKIRSAMKTGKLKRAQQFIPNERVYPVEGNLGKKILIG